MDKIIKNILKKIENEGYEAYIVGGYVRDKILGIRTYDIDICTNARPKDLITLFPKNSTSNEYGGFKFKLHKYNIEITTYRKELKYDNRKPVEIEYINSLVEDIERRDFTINTLCMDKNEKIIDFKEGNQDIYNRIVRSLGNSDIKFQEDPLRMLRAIRFASILNFNIENGTYNSIKKNAELIKTLSDEKVKEELSKILGNSNFKKGLGLLKDLGISDLYSIKSEGMIFVSDILGMWAQMDINLNGFSKNEQDIINEIKSILNTNSINNHDLFTYGLYPCIIAGEILGIPKKDLTNKYNKLPIKSMKDIDIKGDDIIKLLQIEPSKKISEIINKVKNEILNNNLKNKKGEIKKYILRMHKNEQGK